MVRNTAARLSPRMNPLSPRMNLLSLRMNLHHTHHSQSPFYTKPETATIKIERCLRWGGDSHTELIHQLCKNIHAACLSFILWGGCAAAKSTKHSKHHSIPFHSVTGRDRHVSSVAGRFYRLMPRPLPGREKFSGIFFDKGGQTLRSRRSTRQTPRTNNKHKTLLPAHVKQHTQQQSTC